MVGSHFGEWWKVEETVVVLGVSLCPIYGLL